MKTIAFFNNKGGVGKTTLAYHLAWMFHELGARVLVVDLDPQANLTSAFLEDERLEELWGATPVADTVAGALDPLIERLGDISTPHVEDIDGIGLIPGDLALSRFEDRLAQAWPACPAHQTAGGCCISHRASCCENATMSVRPLVAARCNKSMRICA
jgi:chromosome partitioning protein